MTVIFAATIGLRVLSAAPGDGTRVTGQHSRDPTLSGEYGITGDAYQAIGNADEAHEARVEKDPGLPGQDQLGIGVRNVTSGDGTYFEVWLFSLERGAPGPVPAPSGSASAHEFHGPPSRIGASPSGQKRGPVPSDLNASSATSFRAVRAAVSRSPGGGRPDLCAVWISVARRPAARLATLATHPNMPCKAPAYSVRYSVSAETFEVVEAPE